MQPLRATTGILTRTAEARNKTEEAQEKEGLELAVTSSQMEDVNTLEITEEKLSDAIKQQFGNNKDFSITDNEDGSFLVSMNDTQRMYYIDENGEIIDQSKMLKISTADELKAFRDDVNNGNTYEGWYVYLTNNITLDINEEWEPIGIYQEHSTNPDNEANIAFKGIFDGNFNTISGIYTNSELKNRGFFAFIKEATIKNVGIINGNIQGTSRTGGIVGYAYSNSKIINCYNSLAISSNDNFVGGIAGYIREKVIIENCYNNGNIISSGGMIGGIVGGISNSEIKNCYNTGKIEGVSVGGISGGIFTKASIENCYNVGNIKSTVGNAFAINCSGNSLVNFKNNYYLENTVNTSNDLYPQEECKVKNEQEMKELYTILGTAFKNDTNIINDGYPILNWQ